MFKVNPDGMRMEPTPERVISVCRLIAHKSMTRDEVRKAMTLGGNDERSSIRSTNRSMLRLKNCPSSKRRPITWYWLLIRM